MDDGQARVVGQLVQQLGDIAPRVRRVGAACGKQFHVVVNRVVQGLAHRAAAQQVNQLVAGDGMHPCRDGLVGPVGVALVMHG